MLGSITHASQPSKLEGNKELELCLSRWWLYLCLAATFFPQQQLIGCATIDLLLWSSCDWLRANHLLLSLISPADLPDPAGELRPQVVLVVLSSPALLGSLHLVKASQLKTVMACLQYTVQLLRMVDAGMSSFRRSKDWNLYRSLDTWSQVCSLAIVSTPALSF